MERYTTEVVATDMQMLDARGGDVSPVAPAEQVVDMGSSELMDDDIPF